MKCKIICLLLTKFSFLFCSNILTAQNFNQLSKLAASDRSTGNQFGNSVSISGNFAVVGAGNIAGAQIANAGNCAYVFERKTDGSWIQVQKLTPKDPEPDDAFGFSVSINGNYIIVGAPRHDHIIGQYADSKIIDAGAAYIFTRNEAETWIEEKQLSFNATPAAGDMFGYSVSTDGVSFIVGIPGRDLGSLKDCGHALIFRKLENEPTGFGPFNGWCQCVDFEWYHPTEGQAFGSSVSVDGGYAVIGSPNFSKDASNSNDLPGAGAVYVFSTSYNLNSNIYKRYPAYTLVNPDRAAGDQFGKAVAIHGLQIIVGAPYEDEDATGINRLNAAGSAYIFQLNPGYPPSPAIKLVANDRAVADLFGSSVSIYNKYAIVGSVSEDENANGAVSLNSAGSAYLFINDHSGYNKSLTGVKNFNTTVADWVGNRQIKIVASDRAAGDWFGYAVAVHDSIIIIGSPLQDKNNNIALNDAGAVYIFWRTVCTNTSTSISPIACKTYTSPSGKYTWTIAGTYKDTVKNNTGCDSVITINLSFRKVDTSVTINGNTITANAQQANFQWINCANNEMMRITQRSFTPTASGSYAVHVNQNGCASVSSCYTITIPVTDTKPPVKPNPPIDTKPLDPPVNSTPQSNSVLKEFVEINKLVPKDRGGYENFGYSVAINGDYAVIGANVDDKDANGKNPINDAGSAYIFKKDNKGKWIQTQKIVASDREAGDNFGWSVAINNNHIVVGAPYQDKGPGGVNYGPSSGAAYVFELSDEGVWVQKQKLIAYLIESQILFGSSVAIDGNTIAVGCPAYAKDSSGKGESNITSAGAVFVFDKSGGAWVQSQLITVNNRSINNLGDDLGNSVSICGDLIIAGAWGTDYNAGGGQKMDAAGAAYIFERSGGKWKQVQKIVPTDRAAYDEFGISVAISGDNAIIGARRKTETTDPNSRAYTGNAYIFSRRATPGSVRPDGGVILTPDDGSWKQVLKINPEDRRSDDYLGWSVGISGDYAIVSALKQDTDSLDNRIADGGAIYVFYQDKNGRWSQAGKLATADRSQLDNFGYAVAISRCDIIGGTIVDQEDDKDANALTSAGSAYIFSAADCRNVAPCYRATVTPNIKTLKEEIKPPKNINNDTDPRSIKQPKTDSVKNATNYPDLSSIEMCIDRINNNSLPPREPNIFYQVIPTIKPNGELSEISSIKQELSIFTEKMWNPGEVITVGFFPKGNVFESVYNDKVKDIKEYSKYWEAIANVKFNYVNDVAQAQIKIVLQRDEFISWSFLGRDVLFNPFGIATMSYGLANLGSVENLRRTVLHEFGHALGFIHEHQSPVAGIPWDKEKAYAFFGKPPGGLSRMDVDFQIFNKYSTTQINSSTYDPLSIMHYSYPTNLTTDGSFVRPTSKLSLMDSVFAKTVYPFPPDPQNASGTLHTRDDCDEIDFSVEYNVVDQNVIEFILEAGKDANIKPVTWWKKIGIPLKGGVEEGMEIENGNTSNKKIPVIMIDDTKPISFWKAKLLGIHTLLEYKWNVLPAIIGGCRVRLTWKKDTCL